MLIVAFGTSLRVTATELERRGSLPLLAVEATQDGRLVSMAVVDPLEVEWERTGPLSYRADVRLRHELDAIDVQLRVT